MCLVLAGVWALLPMPAGAGTVTSLDADWHFFQGEATGAEQPGFSDASWATVNVPHDWSIAGPFAETNATGGAGAFLPAGVSWYRRTLPAMDDLAGRHCFVEFDGVMANSDVWINGFHLGHRPNGYVGFRYEVTGQLRGGGQANVLAVRTDTAAEPASRWYAGAGIYRHVRLLVTGPVHLAGHATFVSTPVIAPDGATIRVETTVTNSFAERRSISVQATIEGPPHSAPDGSDGCYVCAGESAPVAVPAGGAVKVRLEVRLAFAPRRWSVAHPDLHLARVQVRSGETVLDEEAVPFGIRQAEFTPAAGFLLNGEKVVLKGVCLHQDASGFGVAVPLAVWEDRLKTLRSLGVNAIRTAHNPPAPEFLDLCDRMGFLVMDEFFDCWTVAKNPYDYHLFFKQWAQRDAADTVRRDRNHPCVILYSVGNEIHDTTKPELAKTILAGLVAVCHENDPTRAVTQALFRPNATGDYNNGLADLLDVVGTNYRDKELLAAQHAKPGRKIIGTESVHVRATWLELRDHPSLAGQFLWTGVDYLGESRDWPMVGHASGLLDRTGAVKPMAFERMSWWGETPVVRLARRVAQDDKMPADPGYGGAELHTQVQFADWTPAATGPHTESVEAYSNCGEVELFLNGESLGVQAIHADASPRVWAVPFQPGVLSAVARNQGKPVATYELRTAGPAARLKLAVQNGNPGTAWDSVAVVRATVTDADGVPVPRVNGLVSFQLAGPGVIAAADNGDNYSHETFRAAERHANNGTCVAYVKANGAGELTLTATAPGLPAATLTLPVQTTP